MEARCVCAPVRDFARLTAGQRRLRMTPRELEQEGRTYLASKCQPCPHCSLTLPRGSHTMDPQCGCTRERGTYCTYACRHPSRNPRFVSCDCCATFGWFLSLTKHFAAVAIAGAPPTACRCHQRQKWKQGSNEGRIATTVDAQPANAKHPTALAGAYHGDVSALHISTHPSCARQDETEGVAKINIVSGGADHTLAHFTVPVPEMQAP